MRGRFGWCAGKHPARNPQPAQSGYLDADGNRYCKPCFRKMFPDLYEAKQSARKKACQRCGNVAELAGGFCKPCKRKYQCTSCSKMCPSKDPVLCVHCNDHVALWCTACFSMEERARQCCVFCVKKFPTPVCRLCLKEKPGELRLTSCVNSDCSRRLHICAECEVPGEVTQQPMCMSCWENNERQCVICKINCAERRKQCRRACLPCFEKWYCPKCEKPHPPGVVAQCSACSTNSAVWCRDCLTSV